MNERRMSGQVWVAWALSIIALIAASCTNIPVDQRAFRTAERAGNSDAYERFMRSFPDSTLVDEARKRAAQLKEAEVMRQFENVKDADKAATVERFIAYHRDSPTVVLLAKLRIAEIDYEDMRKDNPFRPSRQSNTSWTGFVSYYAFGKYIPVPEDPALRKRYYEVLHPLLLKAMEKVQNFEMWRAYLQRYPDGPYFKQAADQMEAYLIARSNQWEAYDLLKTYVALYDEELKRSCPNRDMLIQKFHEGLAETVLKKNLVQDYKKYLSMFPDSRLRDNVTHGLLRKQLSEQLLRSDRQELTDIIKEFEKLQVPEKEKDIQQAKARIESLDFDEAVKKRTPQALQQFVVQYSEKDHAKLVPEANARLKKMHDEMLSRAKNARRSGHFREFLRAFPDSPQKKEAESLLEEALFNEAIAGKNSNAIEGLLQTYPDSRFKERALDRIEQLAYEAAVIQAKSVPTTAPLQTYLDTYPKGNFVKEAKDLRNRITEDYRKYMVQLQAAYEKSRPSRFSDWIATNQTKNYYAARRGRQDLDNLRRDLDIRLIEESVLTTPTAQTRRRVEGTAARTLEEYSRMIPLVETNTGKSTGFFYSREGLILTNARIIRNANRRSIKATLRGRSGSCQFLGMGKSENLDAAVLAVKGNFDTIPLGNSATLSENEGIICLSARASRPERLKGTFFGMRKAGTREWLVIQFPDKIPIQLGGVILNRKAEAVGLLVHPDQVDPSAKDNDPTHHYALSLRSTLPVMRSGLEVNYRSRSQ